MKSSHAINPSTLFKTLLCICSFGLTCDTYAQIKYVYSIDYPLRQKTEYIRWVQSIATILQAPEEVESIVSYDDYFSASPHRTIEFEFADIAAAGEYFQQTEIRGALDAVVNRGENADVKVLRLQGDYQNPERAGRSTIRYVLSVNYPLGEKNEYLEWVRSVAETLHAPEEVDRITSYDNYFSTTPHRVIHFEFDGLESAARYFSRPEILQVLEALIDNGQNARIAVHRLRGDYVR